MKRNEKKNRKKNEQIKQQIKPVASPPSLAPGYSKAINNLHHISHVVANKENREHQQPAVAIHNHFTKIY